jgi:hypothetical protein
MDNKSLLYKVFCLFPLLPALFLPGFGVLISLAIVIAVLVAVKPSRGPALALRYGGAIRSFAIGIAVGAAIALAFDFLVEPLVELLTGSPIDLESMANVEGNLVNFLILLALGLLFGGIAEELIFRGFVVGWGCALFGERAGPWLVLLSASVFGAAHLYQGLSGMITTGLIGLLFGILYLSVGRKLLPCIAAHMTVNAYGITQIYLGIA